jgi:putative salt-induced outer membrane protein YdiY
MRGTKPFLFAGALGCALLLTSLVSTAAESAPKTGKQLPDLSWVPPEDSFDWIQLKSGEWLKGTFKALQERELDFDSEELDFLSFDAEKIRQLRTANPVQIKLISGEVYSGRVMVTPDKVSIPGEPNHEWPRSQLQSLTPAGSRERSFWSGNVSVGLTKRGGNVEETDFSGMAHLQRRNPSTRFTLDYNADYSKVSAVVNDNNWRIAARLDTWITHRFYVVLPVAEYYSDPIQNIGDRTTIGAGIAYDIFDTKDLELTVSGGPGYQWLRYTSALSGEPDRREGGALGVATNFKWDITKDIDWTLQYSAHFASAKAGDTTHHLQSKLSVDVTKRLTIDLSFIWDKTVSPPATADGTRPESDDYRIVFGLGLEF